MHHNYHSSYNYHSSSSSSSLSSSAAATTARPLLTSVFPQQFQPRDQRTSAEEILAAKMVEQQLEPMTAVPTKATEEMVSPAPPTITSEKEEEEEEEEEERKQAAEEIFTEKRETTTTVTAAAPQQGEQQIGESRHVDIYLISLGTPVPTGLFYTCKRVTNSLK